MRPRTRYLLVEGLPLASVRIGGLPGACVALAFLAAAGCQPYAHLTETGPGGAASADCGHCHVEVFEEWSASSHATSWTNEAFIEATSGHLFGSCLGCHAPFSIFSGGAPVLRADHREEGVSCIACHLDHGVLAGPVPSTALIDPHPVAAERAIYLSARLCGQCHEGTYEEWLDAEGERTCQGCHMAEVTRKVTQADGMVSRVLVAFENQVVGRRHSFNLDAVADFEGAVEAQLVAFERIEEALHCTVEVVGRIPHRIPTGDFGFRRVRLTLEGFDARGAPVGQREWELYKELGSALEPNEPQRFTLELPLAAQSLRLSMSRSKRDGQARSLLAEVWRLSVETDQR